jgi:trigger factor
MQVMEATNDGLKRTLKVVVGTSELNDRFTARLDEVKDTVQLKGFRRGKVPVQHIRKIFGRSLMAEVVQQALIWSSGATIRSSSAVIRNRSLSAASP